MKIDMRQYVLSAQHDSDVDTEYALYAVSVHFGGMGGGHYTAFARSSDNTDWYDYNDASVSRVEDTDVEETIVTGSAYLLFYLRRDFWPKAWGGTRDYDAEFVAPPSAAAPSSTDLRVATTDVTSAPMQV